jgi:hypothetical protein
MSVTVPCARDHDVRDGRGGDVVFMDGLAEESVPDRSPNDASLLAVPVQKFENLAQAGMAEEGGGVH